MHAHTHTHINGLDRWTGHVCPVYVTHTLVMYFLIICTQHSDCYKWRECLSQAHHIGINIKARDRNKLDLR